MIKSLERAAADRRTGMGHVQSLVRAFHLLDLLAEHDDGLNLTELAKAVSLPRSTAHRLLTTMLALRYLDFDKRTHRWMIGIQALTIGQRFSQVRDLARLGRPIMRSLMFDAHETVNISIPSVEGIQYVGQVESLGASRTSLRPGIQLPMHTTASGKAMLAHLSLGELDTFFRDHSLSRRTDSSITDASRLVEQIRIIRKRGYAVDDEENSTGLRCVASVVLDKHGEPRAALSISGPVSRLRNDRLQGLGTALTAAAKRMTTDIGAVLAGCARAPAACAT